MNTLTAENMETREDMRSKFPKGSTLYTLVRSVGSNGTTRRISVFAIRLGEIVSLDWEIERAGIAKRRGAKDGLFIGGVGMDMTEHLVMNIGHALYGDGYAFKNVTL